METIPVVESPHCMWKMSSVFLTNRSSLCRMPVCLTKVPLPPLLVDGVMWQFCTVRHKLKPQLAWIFLPLFFWPKHRCNGQDSDKAGRDHFCSHSRPKLMLSKPKDRKNQVSVDNNEILSLLTPHYVIKKKISVYPNHAYLGLWFYTVKVKCWFTQFIF
jgi:hypothetical protein